MQTRSGTGEDAVDRREFVAAVTWGFVSAALAGCGNGVVSNPTGVSNPSGGGPSGGGQLPAGVTVNSNVTTIDLSQQPGLSATSGFLLIVPVHVFIVKVGTSAFRAFTSICTHQQCDVNDFSGGTINCPCHGSQFDTSGQVVRGPAPLPLQEFATSFDASANRLTVTKP